jgi:DNA-binding response OmpR family regulator
LFEPCYNNAPLRLRQRSAAIASTGVCCMTTILIIDEDLILLARLAVQLEEAGYRVLRASDILQAEHQATEETPDLILIDPTAQHGAGWRLLERLAPRVPMIVVSGAGLEEEVVRGLDAGAADYLSKPFRSAELLARIRRHLRTTGPAPVEGSALALPSTTDPVDRLRRSSVEQQRPIEPERRKRQDALGERRIEVEAPDRRDRRKEEEPVFISPTEEHQLFAQPEPSSEELRIAEMSQLPIGQRLKTARQRRRITLVQAELDTKLRMYYIQAMEDEKFSLLPSGPASSEMLRTYASYLGIGLSDADNEFHARSFTPIAAPLFALGGSLPVRQIPRWLVMSVAVLLALAIGIGGIWAFDSGRIIALAGRARALMSAPAATALPAPTTLPTAPPTTPLAQPTASLVPSATPSRSPTPTALPALEPSPLP